MIKDPGQIYSGFQQDTETGPGPKAPKISHADAYLQMRDASAPNMTRAGASFQAPDAPAADYHKYFGDTGISDPALTGDDLKLEMGQRQGVWDKIGRRLGSMAPNIIAGVVDFAGNIGSLFTEWGDDRDYKNGLNAAADQIRQWTGENIGNTYRRSNDTWALGDPTWWIDNIATTGELAASFALGGEATGALLAKAGEGIAEAANLGAKASNFVRTAAQIGNSSLMSYAFGAQAGANVYKETYHNQLMKALAAGQDQDQADQTAKHIASQSAATTAQLTTMLTLGMNVKAFAPLFREAPDAVREMIADRIGQTEGKTLAETGEAVRSMNPEDYADKLANHQTISARLGEMAKMGGEMALMHFAEKTGSDLGKKGQTKGFFQQFGELENLTDRVANSEGLLSFVLGAGFGGLQHMLIHDVIPSKRVDRLDPQGNPVQVFNEDGSIQTDQHGAPVTEKTWVTPRKYENDFTQKLFTNMRDAVAEDYSNYSDLQDEFLAAHKAGKALEADEARDRMFDPTKLHAIKYGLTDPWIKTFQEIANLTPEQAAQRSLSDGTSTRYKDQANRAVGDIQHLQKVYEGLQKTYGTKYTQSQNIQPLVDMVFAREADLHSQKNRIDAYEKELEGHEAEERSMAQIMDPAGYNEAVGKYSRDLSSAKEVERQLLADHKSLVTAYAGKDAKTLTRLLRKYRAVGMGDGSIDEPVKVLDQKLKAKLQEVSDKVKNSEAAMLAHTDYDDWLKKNPDGKFDEYMQEAQDRHQIGQQNAYRRAEVEKAKMQYDISREHLSEMTKEKNANRFSKKVSEWHEQLRKQEEESQKNESSRIAEMTKDKSTLDRLQKAGMNRIADQYKGFSDKIKEEMAANEERIADAQKELAGTHRDLFRSMALRRQIKNMKKENETYAKRAAHYDSLYSAHHVDDKEPESIPVEDVTGEKHGVTGDDAVNNPTTNTTANPPSEEKTTTVDEDYAAIIGAAPEAESEAVAPTVEQELEAMRKQVENAAPEAEELDPAVQFRNITGSLSTPLRDKINTIVQKLMQGEPFSYDLLQQEVASGKLSQEKAARILQAAKEYVEEGQKLIAASEVQASIVPTNQGSEVPPPPPDEVIVEGIGTPVTPKIALMPPDPKSTPAPEGPDYHSGYKIVDAATTGATSTIAYHEGTKRDKEGKIMYVKVTKPTELLHPASEDILKPGKLLPNHPLRFEVDVDYDGPKHITDSLSWDSNHEVVMGHEKGSDYLNHEGKVKTRRISVSNEKAIADIEKRRSEELAKSPSGGFVIRVHNPNPNEENYIPDDEEIADRDTRIEWLISKGVKNGRSADEILRSVTTGHAFYTQDIISIKKFIEDRLEGKTSQPFNEFRRDTHKETNARYDAELAALKTTTKEVHDPLVVGNVPIRVVDGQTGKYLFHLRTLDWLQAKFPGTKDYRNVAETVPGPNGEAPIDNIELQRQRLMEIRTAIVEKFNKEGKGSDGTISAKGKGTGRLILNHVVESKDSTTKEIKSKVKFELAYNRKNPDKSLLPDAKLELVIASPGTIMSGRGFEYTKALGFDPKQLTPGQVGAMVPSANGQMMFAPLVGEALAVEGKASPALQSVVRAIELFLLNDGSSPAITNEISNLESETGFNIGTAKGLKAFINQFYTYTQAFQDSALSPNASGAKEEGFLFHIDDSVRNVDKTKQVKAGFAMRGDGAHYANLVKGRLDPNFMQVLKEGFQTRQRAVVFTHPEMGMKGINSQGSFREAVYSAKGWKFNDYDSYNQYVKSFSRTSVYGRNQLSDGTHVYTANPHLNIDAPDLRHQAALVMPNETATTIKPEDKPTYQADVDLFDQLANNSLPSVPKTVQAFGAGSDHSRPLDQKTLEDLYNFTPEAERNGKTPQEVLYELTSRGHSYLSEGFNPFSRCL